MEELRSTEILDKEIIADAQKKAERINAKADEECARIASSVQGRVEEEIRKANESLSLKISSFKRDLDASVPLEKARFYVSFVQNSIEKNINEYLSSVSEDKIIGLLVSKTKDVQFEDLNLKAYVYGLDEKKAEKALKDVLGRKLQGIEKTEFNRIIYEDSFLTDNKGIILLSENQEIKCRFTLTQIIDGILDKYRAELAEALFGKDSE